MLIFAAQAATNKPYNLEALINGATISATVGAPTPSIVISKVVPSYSEQVLAQVTWPLIWSLGNFSATLSVNVWGTMGVNTVSLMLTPPLRVVLVDASQWVPAPGGFSKRLCSDSSDYKRGLVLSLDSQWQCTSRQLLERCSRPNAIALWRVQFCLPSAGRSLP